jgi:hypothetical protein
LQKKGQETQSSKLISGVTNYQRFTWFCFNSINNKSDFYVTRNELRRIKVRLCWIFCFIKITC